MRYRPAYYSVTGHQSLSRVTVTLPTLVSMLKDSTLALPLPVSITKRRLWKSGLTAYIKFGFTIGSLSPTCSSTSDRSSPFPQTNTYTTMGDYDMLLIISKLMLKSSNKTIRYEHPPRQFYHRCQWQLCHNGSFIKRTYNQADVKRREAGFPIQPLSYFKGCQLYLIYGLYERICGRVTLS
jgi:hypothetical protein